MKPEQMILMIQNFTRRYPRDLIIEIKVVNKIETIITTDRRVRRFIKKNTNQT